VQVLKDDVRGRIIEAAKTAFADAGFVRTSMKEIAAKAGVTPGNLYRYFPGKDDLFVAVVAPAVADVKELIVSANPPDTGASADFDAFRETIADRTYNLLTRYHIELRILLHGAEQSSMANTRQLVVHMFYNKLLYHVGLLVPNTPLEKNLTVFLEVMAKAYVGSMVDVLIETDPHADDQLVRYLLSGIGELYFRNMRELIGTMMTTGKECTTCENP
jgi:AcrR family transcriptional regulator